MERRNPMQELIGIVLENEVVDEERRAKLKRDFASGAIILFTRRYIARPRRLVLLPSELSSLDPEEDFLRKLQTEISSADFIYLHNPEGFTDSVIMLYVGMALGFEVPVFSFERVDDCTSRLYMGVARTPQELRTRFAPHTNWMRRRRLSVRQDRNFQERLAGFQGGL